MQVELNKYNNDWYDAGAGRVKRFFWYYTNQFFFNSYWFPFATLKITLLRIYGAKVGKGVVIKPKVNIKYPWHLRIGSGVWIGEDVWIDNLTEVKIEDNCCISQGAMLLTGNHNYKKSTFDLIVGQITLKEGVWIGAKSIVCPGVTCHSYAVLSVGSVANKNLEAYGIYTGNPAKKVKERIFEG
ncbi:MAG: WcaF family extracellular polysaccharide biosynthesis acetyltransferase [Bacteroidota bacterium]